MSLDGIDVDSKDETGLTPLPWAAQQGDVGIMRLLLGNDGMNVYPKDKTG